MNRQAPAKRGAPSRMALYAIVAALAALVR